MADDGIWTTNAMIQARAGENANATAKATAATDAYVLQVEAMVNVLTNYNWSDAVTTGLNADVQGILEEITSSLCAINVINQDMSGFTSTAEAQTMMNVLRDVALRDLSIIKNKNRQDFINGA